LTSVEDMTDRLANEADQKSWLGVPLTIQWDLLALWLPLLGVGPLLVLHAVHLWDRPHLQFFPVTIGLVAWFAFKEIPSEKRLSGGGRFWISLTILMVAFSAHWASLLIYSPWLAHVGMVLSFVAWGLVRLHQTPWSRVLGLTILLASTVPLPLNVDRRLIAELQAWSSKACSYALDGLQIPNLLQGNVLQIENHTLFVEEACSGVTSLYSLISLALLFTLFQQRSLAQGIVTLVLTPLVAINGNILRLLLIALGFQWWNIDLTSGMPHTILGIVVFATSGLALLCIDLLVASLLAPIPKLSSDRSLFRRIYNTLAGWPSVVLVASSRDELGGEEVEEELPTPEPKWVRQLGLGRLAMLPILVTVYVLLFIPTTIAALNEYKIHDQMFGSAGISREIADMFPSEKSLPEQLAAGWRRAGYKVETRETHNQHGQYSHVWRLVKGEQSLIVSLDFAFRGWHTLDVCYTNAGWRVSSTKTAETKDGDPWPWVESQMTNDLGLSGYLWYSFFDEKGEPFAGDLVRSGLEKRMDRNILRFWRNEGSVIFPRTFQSQIFIESGPPLSEKDTQELRRLHLEIREIMRQQSLPALKRLGGK
jgi:exosortase